VKCETVPQSGPAGRSIYRPCTPVGQGAYDLFMNLHLGSKMNLHLGSKKSSFFVANLRNSQLLRSLCAWILTPLAPNLLSPE